MTAKDRDDLTKIENRLRKIRKHEKARQLEFAKTLCMSQQLYSKLELGVQQLRFDVIMRILERYPWVSREWFLFGKGQMLKRYKHDD